MNYNKPKKSSYLSKFSPGFIAILYVIAGSLWIIGTDYIALGHIAAINHLFYISLIKGLVFVILTALLFYSLLKKLSEISAEVEENLRLAEDKYKIIVESSNDGIWVIDADEKTTFVNDRMAEMLGLSAGEILNHCLYEFIDTEWQSIAKQNVERRKQGLREQYDLKFNKGDGTSFWAMVAASPLSDQNQNYIGSLGMISDITERKEVEDKLLDYQQNLSDIIKYLPDATFAIDKNGVVIAWNKAIEEMAGISALEMLGKGDHEYSLPFYHTKRPLLVDGVLNREIDLAPLYTNFEKDTNNLVAESYFEYFGDGGMYIWAKASSLYNAYGEVVGAVESIRDITFKKNTEQQIIKLNQELEERVLNRTAELARANSDLKNEIAEREKTEMEVKSLNEKLSSRATELEAVNSELESFSYSVSHDLRTPLRSIDGFSQMIIEDYSDSLDEKAKECFIRIRNASQRMGQLIDDLYDLSKLTRIEMVKEKIYMTKMALAVEEDLRRLYPDRDVKLLVENDIFAEGDPHLMHIVIENLLGNAWKFTSQKENAIIEFGTIKKDETQIYYIKDNGIGFDMTFSSKLFRAFERLHNSKEYPGTGIGLAIVERIIKKHGGKVWAESVLGEGSTFYFTLLNN